MFRWLREPLLHFFILGGLLFAAYGYIHRNTSGSEGEIVLTEGELSSIVSQHEALWGRPPSSQELKGLIDNWVHDEVLYREGVSMGLDRDDPIVRRRIEQKVEFIGDGNSPTAPTDDELQAWLDAHADDYRTEPQYTLQQIYFDRGRHGGGLDADVMQAKQALDQGKAFAGDASSLPATMTDVRGAEIVAIFGTAFEKGLHTLPVGTWEGPVDSGLGVHLVKLEARTPGRIPALADVRPAVERDLLHSREVVAKDTFYQSLRKRYTLRIDADVAAATAPRDLPKDPKAQVTTR